MTDNTKALEAINKLLDTACMSTENLHCVEEYTRWAEIARDALTAPAEPVTCKNCGGAHLSWFVTNSHDGGISQGRLNTSDVQCLFVLGCEDCSETVLVKRADDVAKDMNVKVSGGVNQVPEFYQYRHYTHSGKPYWDNERVRNGSTSNEVRPLYTSPPSDAARIAELEAEKRELLEALEPFATRVNLYFGLSDEQPHDDTNERFTFGELRRAAALHAKLKGDA